MSVSSCALKVGQEFPHQFFATWQKRISDAADIAAAKRIMVKYAELDPGLADASIVVLAARNGIRDVLTLDRRHFDVMRQANSRPFRVRP